jgi:hypothetical protein
VLDDETFRHVHCRCGSAVGVALLPHEQPKVRPA